MSFKLEPFVWESSNTSGSGPLTLAGALNVPAVDGVNVPSRRFSSFLANGDTTWYVARNRQVPAEWEEGIGTWGTGHILTRTTVIKSSNAGSAVSFSPGTKDVICGLPSGAMLPLALPSVVGADADTTLAPNTRNIVDMSQWATADRTYTLPTTAAIGDRISVGVLVGNASFELILKTGAGQTCAFAGSVIGAATEITRLFITGESMAFYYAATNKWMVDVGDDGRIAMCGVMILSAACDGESASTYTRPTQAATPGTWQVDENTGNICSASGDSMLLRRACKAECKALALSKDTVNDGQFVSVGLFKNVAETQVVRGHEILGAVSVGTATAQGARVLKFAADDYLVFKYRSQQGAMGLTAGEFTAMSVVEKL